MSAPAVTPRTDVNLDDRYTADSGAALISGVQALVRVVIDQRRLDIRRGLDTAAFISGYQGSPLGGLDSELVRAKRHLDPLDVVFQAGVNEELAATAVSGTQLIGELDKRRHDGVTGYWFGKNPGLDRAADAIRHGNLTGTSPIGGAVAWIGDDPSSKSSTLPSSCEPMCRSLRMPVLSPGSVQEVLEFGLHAVALSRFAGLWAGVKIVSDTADASAIADMGIAAETLPDLPIREAGRPPILLPPTNLEAEHDQMTARLARAAEYVRIAGLNRVRFEPRTPRIAVVAAGMGYQAVRRAVDELGLDHAALDHAGIRLVQLGVPWPIDASDAQRLVGDVETVLVVEDKMPFIEGLLRDALYRRPDAPLILGKEDADGRPLLSARSTLAADDVARAIGRIVENDVLPARARARVDLLDITPDAHATTIELPSRTPYFCSGCPHNVSTRADIDQLVGVGIGCHTMVVLDGGDRRGHLLGMPQMGGEGGQWLGLSPFTDDVHFTQNLGDGTFHHSGSLAIRAAVAAGVNITYRLLYNDAVAMTGGQQPQGKMSVPTLTRWFEVEGVTRVVVTTPEPDRYDGVAISPIAEVRHRDDLQKAAAELAATSGVTVLIHDDQCATEKRRMRKRGKLTAPAERVMINERVCEGCGDCGEKSTCLSVLPVDTEFGRKTQIHQSSCNQDFTCLKGDCPSFLLVTPKDGKLAKPAVPEVPVALADPAPRVARDVLIRMPGIGGTGVVTTSQILQMAAHLDGRRAAGLEQVGLAQKGGPVISDVRIGDGAVNGQLRAGRATADVILAFDPVGASSNENVAVADPDRTVAVVNTAATPTAGMITDVRASAAGETLLVDRLRRATRADDLLTVDAGGLSQRLFGDHMPVNMLLVGAAFQHGCLPISEAAIDAAIRMNGAAVETNLAAFRWGRAAAADPAAVARALLPAEPLARQVSSRARALVAELAFDGPLRDLVTTRVDELVAYQGPAYAARYRDAVLAVAETERRRTTDSDAPVTEAFARGLHKLMAYKDEYEVARLHLDETERARVAETFGEDAEVQIMLHPPVLRAMGMTRKIKVSERVARPALRALYAARGVRGTRVDPFGRAKVRQVERALIGEYRTLVDRALEHLHDGNAGQVAEIVGLPDVIRGYEDIKLRNVDEFRLRAQALLEHLAKAAAPPTLQLKLHQSTKGS